ncbi:MAG: UDP-N-acetylglucosamine 1-carboxyvinyltransferase [bacterium]|nr:UDP-N-acetylglucosamine 1-carboxyvinyltransferase [bacterium]
MPHFLIQGGCALGGEISVSGSKNSALPALASSLLFKDKPEFHQLPDIEDIKRMNELISSIDLEGKMDMEIAKRFRASILPVGPILARHGVVSFPHPGGCVIGARPIDVFLSGWEAMGAKIKTPAKTEGGNLIYEAEAKGGLKGADYAFKTQSVTGTEGMMMTAVLAKGGTTLRNCAMEPEITYLADFLNRNGARVTGAGTTTIHIEGREGKLLPGREPFVAPPDRIEAGTFLILGALAADELLIKNIFPEEVASLTALLKEAGVEITQEKNFALVKKIKKTKAVHVKTKEYPGFATDLQAPFAVFATQAEGQSLIHETIFEGRLAYTADLNRMGANISLMDPHRAIVSGPTPLYGRKLESPDLRAGLAFMIAALIAEGESQIGNIYQIDRGHERIDERLRAIGADIKRI